MHAALPVVLLLGVPFPGRSFAQAAARTTVEGSVPLFGVGPATLTVDGGVDRLAMGTRARTMFDVGVTAGIASSRQGFAIGVRGEQADRANAIPLRPLPELAVWQAYGPVVIRFNVMTHVAMFGGRATIQQQPDRFIDSVGYTVVRPGGQRTVVGGSRVQYWSEFEAVTEWTRGTVQLAALIGGRPGVDRFRATAWGQLAGSWRFASRAGVMAGVGNAPMHVAFGIPRSTFVSLGLRFSPARRHARVEALPEQAESMHAAAAVDSAVAPGDASAAQFAIRPSALDTYTVVFTSPGARTVELSGDFDRWAPVSLIEVAPGRWEVALRLAPGTYRMNLRIDGATWTPPPGVPEVVDDFGGRVGVVVVR